MKSPVNEIRVKAPGVDTAVRICTKGQWEDLLIALKTKDEATLRTWVLGMTDKVSAYAPPIVYEVFCEAYKQGIDNIVETYSDFYALPYTPYDPEIVERGCSTTEKMELPIATYTEGLVREHTGLDFLQIQDLDILTYKLYLSDAMKLRILNARGSKKGTVYLNECYRFAHKINTGF